MSSTIALDEIPGPRGLPLLGNAFDIDGSNPIEGFMRMADEYGPIFRLTIPGGTRLLLSRRLPPALPVTPPGGPPPHRLGRSSGRRDLRRHTVRQAGRWRPGESAPGS